MFMLVPAGKAERREYFDTLIEAKRRAERLADIRIEWKNVGDGKWVDVVSDQKFHIWNDC